MKRFFVVLAMLILTSCGKDSGSGTTGQKWDIDAEYQEAYNYFIQEGNARGIAVGHLEVSIKKSVPLPKGDYVLCLPGRKVLINEAQVNYYVLSNNAPSFRTWVVFHGLGHCLLNKPEVDGYSIMNLYSYSINFDVNRSQSLHDFFFSIDIETVPQDGVN